MNDSTEYWQTTQRVTESKTGMVAAQQALAARAGASMLHEGGNAIDAAVATAFALAAVEPWMCGLGGSGYMVIWHEAKQRAIVLDFQGMLPAGINPQDYPLDPSVPDTIMGFPGVRDQRNVVGYGAISVPGAVKGLCHALEHYGSFELDKVLSPAIQLADAGLPCNWFTTLQISLAANDLRANAAASSIYLPNGLPPAPEQNLPLGALPDSLRLLADQGPDAMYGGRLGELMCADLKAGGSRITLDDFAAYRVQSCDALSGTHRGVDLHTAGPTSGGPRLLQTLTYVEDHLDLSQGLGPHTYKVYADGLHQAWQSHNVGIGRTTEVGGCTSHMSTVDKDGNMVALTYTLLNRFGACVVLPQSGILMNNAVSYFDPRPGYPTSMQAHKRINASNMCPTIATRDNRSLFAIGASGANYIMPCTTQIAALMLDYGLSMQQAFNQPRIDVGGNASARSVRVDPRLGQEVMFALKKDYQLEVAQQLVFPKLYACPSGVARDLVTGVLEGINDPSQPVGAGIAAQPFNVPASSPNVAVRA